MLYVKPPWTLIHLLQCFRKHWLAVFGLVMEKNLLLTIESLYENVRKGMDLSFCLWKCCVKVRIVDISHGM